jgi:hypothetical protein
MGRTINATGWLVISFEPPVGTERYFVAEVCRRFTNQPSRI